MRTSKYLNHSLNCLATPPLLLIMMPKSQASVHVALNNKGGG